MVPFPQRTSSGILGFIPDSRRISLGITNRPPRSMVVSWHGNYHLLDCLPSQNDGLCSRNLRRHDTRVGPCYV